MQIINATLKRRSVLGKREAARQNDVCHHLCYMPSLHAADVTKWDGASQTFPTAINLYF